MARTKQTARKTMASKGPRAALASRGVKGGKGAIMSKSSPAPAGSYMEVEVEDKDLIDTQQFVVKFDDQAECQKKAVKSPIFRCKECDAILTSQSKVLTNKDYQQVQKKASKQRLETATSDQIKQKFLNTKQSVWICEFCCHHNEVDPKFTVEKEENPCFQVENVKKKGGKNKKSAEEDSDQILIFCIDISSSMDDNVQTDSKKGRTNKLQCVKEAIIDELRNLREKGTKKVGIVTFGSEVNILGDGSKPATKLQCNIYNFDEIVKGSGGYDKLFSTNISKSYDKLKTAIDKMHSNGSTALGPALVASTVIASKGGLGSKVIICTDGQANTGIGTDPSFYDQMGAYAKDNHVAVSVLTIKGANCNVKLLGRVSSATRGSIMKVDPAKLGTEFSKIISNEILGVDSEIAILLNKRFSFRGVDPKLLSDHDRVLKDNLGSFSADTQLTYSFDVIPAEDAMTLKHVNLDLYREKNLPMQVQLTYTGLNGNRYLQVITDWREMTTDEAALFEDANFGVFAASILQKVSKYITDGQFDQAQKLIVKYKRLCEEKFSKFKENEAKIKQFDKRIERLEGVLKSKKAKKMGIKVAKGAKYADEPDDEEDEEESEESPDRSRSRSRSRGRGRHGPLTKQKKKSATKKMKVAYTRALSSDEEEAVLYKEMEAHQMEEQD